MDNTIIDSFYTTTNKLADKRDKIEENNIRKRSNF